jgi:hypothetical protein
MTRLLLKRFRRTITVAGAGLLAALGLAVAGGAEAVPAVAATSSCSAAYSVNDWGSGFTASLAVTNNGTAAITGWTVTYSYAGNQTLSNGWNGNWTQSGKTVTVTNAPYNGSLGAGAATSAGANFSYSGTNAAPASVTCTPAGSVTPPGSITATPASLNVTQGKTGTFTLALSQAPSANETVSIAASGNTGLTASPASLTFTPANFATPQTVTVTANATGTGTTTFTATGSGYTAATVTATEVPSNNGTPTLMVAPASQTITQGTTGTAGISLSSAPASNVTVSVARTSGNTGLTVAPASLTFTPANFATAQSVTVTADSASSGAATFTVSASGLTSVTFTATEAPLGTGSAPQLHVSGNKLVNASGSTVVLHGVNRSGTEYKCVQSGGIFDGPNDQASITAIKSWGPVNAVRVPLNEACWNAESYVGSAFSGATYINAIKSYVSLLNSNGIVAILDLHWTDGTYTGPGQGSCTSSNQAQAFCQKPMPDAAQAVPFWTSVANTFKGNDAVVFDLFNEPFPEQADGNNETEGWACWLNGGSSCVGLSYTVAGMQTLVNAVRSAGANNVLMLGGLEWSNDLTQWLQHEPTDPDHNLAASWHSYNFNACSNQSCWTSQVAPVAAQVPVIAGEVGENDCAGGYITPVMKWMESAGISFLAWAWNADFACSSGPGLITDYTGTPTGYGAAYKAILQALPAG